jgi:hypothetical protein
MGARRFPWIWWATGALFLLLLVGWVFRASLKEQQKPRSSFGKNTFEVDGNRYTTHAVDPNNPPTNPAFDPHVQETLRTIDEINRINELNENLRNNPIHAEPPKQDTRKTAPEIQPQDLAPASPSSNP